MSTIIETLLSDSPFSLSKEEKRRLYEAELFRLTKNSYDSCENYQKILNTLSFDVNQPHNVEDFPYLPVRLFKEYDLLNVSKEEVVKCAALPGMLSRPSARLLSISRPFDSQPLPRSIPCELFGC